MGLPDNAVKESNYRIAAALTNTNYKLPGKRITINLAPTDLRNEGSAYDLPIAIKILVLLTPQSFFWLFFCGYEMCKQFA